MNLIQLKWNKSLYVIGLKDIYDIETGQNNFSVKFISDEVETYF